MKEEYKDIQGYENIYQISNFGNVKSLDRIVIDSRKGVRKYKGKILKATKDGTGYLRVVLCKEGKRKDMKVHQLVAIAFLGHKPNGYKIVVDHIDNNPLNNKLSNLQIISNREDCSKDKKGTSKYTGVNWHTNNQKWIAKITIKGKKKHLGYFSDELLAHKAYQTALTNLK